MVNPPQTIDPMDAFTKRYIVTADGLFVSIHSFGYDRSIFVKPGDMIRSRGENDWRTQVVSVNAETGTVTFTDTEPPDGKAYTWQTSAEDLAIRLRLGERQYKAA